MRRFAPTLLIVTAALSCQPKVVSQDGSEAKIFGGGAVEAEDPAEKFTAAITKLDGRVVCSATLVSPTVLVTAAHCLKPSFVGEGLRVVFGRNTKSGTAVEVKAYGAHPKYNPALAGSIQSQYDIGLIAIAAPFVGSTPLTILTADVSLSSFVASIKIAGFGSTGDGVADTGILRSATTSIGAESRSSQEVFFDGLKLTNACTGDSGGPAWVEKDGQRFLLGAASYVVEINDKTCDSGIASYSDLRAYRYWIDRMIKALPTGTGKVEVPEAVQ